MRTPMSRLEQALAAFDAANAQDPNFILLDGHSRPRELVQAERLSAWVLCLAPDASEAAQLAARCQHLRRWQRPRTAFAEGRVGYLTWRTELGRFHADCAQEILEHVGYEPATLAKVRAINLKQGLRSNADTQLIEDALCLVFLEHEFQPLADKHSDEKLIEILRKTWRKMTPRGHARALLLPLAPRLIVLLQAALIGEVPIVDGPERT